MTAGWPHSDHTPNNTGADQSSQQAELQQGSRTSRTLWEKKSGGKKISESCSAGKGLIGGRELGRWEYQGGRHGSDL